jgi:hypothetical protein
LDISLDKTRLSGMMKSLYLEASELELWKELMWAFHIMLMHDASILYV